MPKDIPETIKKSFRDNIANNRPELVSTNHDLRKMFICHSRNPVLISSFINLINWCVSETVHFIFKCSSPISIIQKVFLTHLFFDIFRTIVFGWNVMEKIRQIKKTSDPSPTIQQMGFQAITIHTSIRKDTSLPLYLHDSRDQNVR